MATRRKMERLFILEWRKWTCCWNSDIYTPMNTGGVIDNDPLRIHNQVIRSMSA